MMNQNNISLETVLHALYGCSGVQSGFTDAVYVCPICGNVIHSMGEAVINCHGIVFLFHDKTLFLND